MKRAETLDAINRLEKRYPVAEWTGRGERVWPLVRAALSWRSFTGYVESRRWGPRHEQLDLLGQIVGTRLRSVSGGLRSRGYRASTRTRYDAVFFGLDWGRIWVGDAWYDRLCDPLRDLLAKRDLASVALDPGRDFPYPRRHPSTYVQPALDMAILRSAGPPWPAGQLHYPGFDELVLAAGREGLDTSGVAAAATRQVRQLWRVAAFFEAVLSNARPRVAFVVSYGIPSMAFNLACARLRIPSVEIQHGVQGPLHWAYSRWSSVPPGGYSVLPDAYWVWSSEEAAVIEDWAAAMFPRHRAVPGGNLWLDLWRDGSADLVRAADRPVRAAIERSPGERHVLIALHRAVASRDSLQPFMTAIAARPEWRWWVRSHPGMTASEGAAVKRVLAEVPGARLELKASELPLYAVLRHVDAVATMASSVVIEAAALGVPSAIIDADVGEQYAGEIAAGWAQVADRSLAETLDALIARAPELSPYEQPRISPDEALDDVLGAGSRG